SRRDESDGGACSGLWGADWVEVGRDIEESSFRLTTPSAPIEVPSEHFLDGAATPPFQGVSRAVLLASSITERKSAARKQRTYRPTSLRGEFATSQLRQQSNAYVSHA